MNDDTLSLVFAIIGVLTICVIVYRGTSDGSN